MTPRAKALAWSTRLLRCALVLLVSCCVLAAAAPCRADTATAVYDDVKDVLTRLVERRASADAARFVRRSSAGLGFYLTHSLEHVRRGQWGALQDALTQDFADLAADYVYWELTHPTQLAPLRTTRDPNPVFNAFLACFEQPAFDEAAGLHEACRPLRDQLAKTQGLHRSTLVYEQCQARTPPEEYGQEFSCDAARLVHAAMLENADEAHLYAVEVLSAAGSFAVPDFDQDLRAKKSKYYQSLRSLLQEALDGVPQQTTPVWPLKTEPSSALYGALQACPDRPLSELVRSALDAPAVKDELSLPLVCLNARLHTSLSAVLPASKVVFVWAPVPLANVQVYAQENPWIRSPAQFDVVASGDGTNKIFECHTDNHQAVVDARCAVVGGPPEERFSLSELIRLSAALDTLATRVLSNGALGERVSCPGTCPFQALELGARLAGLREQVAELVGRRTLASVSLEIERGLRIVADSERRSSGSVVTCVKLMVPSPESNSDIPDILRAALSGQRAELATFALRGAFDDVFDNGGGGSLDPLFANLIVTIVQFELGDPRTDGASISKDALRAAGIQLLDGLRSQEGFQRQGLSVYPVATLRASWNQGYLNERGDNGLRYVPSLDWPAERVRMSAATSVQFTLLDALAPLAEVAARAEGSYDHESLLLLDALRPRLNLLVGFPDLDNNIAASVGMAFRTITVVPATGDTERHYEPTLRAKQHVAQALEVNLGIAYVF